MNEEVFIPIMALIIVSAQVQEMGQIRTHLYELEKMHQRIKAEYFYIIKSKLIIIGKMRKSLDCEEKKQSWKEKRLQV